MSSPGTWTSLDTMAGLPASQTHIRPVNGSIKVLTSAPRAKQSVTPSRLPSSQYLRNLNSRLRKYSSSSPSIEIINYGQTKPHQIWLTFVIFLFFSLILLLLLLVFGFLLGPLWVNYPILGLKNQNQKKSKSIKKGLKWFQRMYFGVRRSKKVVPKPAFNINFTQL